MNIKKEIVFKKIIDECRNNPSAYGRFDAFVNRKLAGRYFVSNKKLFKLSKQDYPEEFINVINGILSKRILQEGQGKESFLKMQDGKDLAAFFEIPYSALLYSLGLINRTSNSSRYSEFTIPKKSSGIRLISAPNHRLLNLQRSIADVLNLKYKPPKSAHGFVASYVSEQEITQVKNIVTNAKQHRNKKLVLNIDLKDFFPSITGARIFKLFQSKPFNFNSKVAGLLTEICIHDKYKCLPQGAATSPVLSNMIALGLDLKLIRLASEYQLTFTRYADDITFSTSRDKFPDELKEKITEIIHAEGFEVNEAKVRIQNRKMRQEVTGIIVNKRLNVPRKYIRNVRAMLNNWQKKGIDECQRKLEESYSKSRKEGFPDFRRVLLGKIEYIGAVRGKDKSEDTQELYLKFKDRYFLLLNGGEKALIENKSNGTKKDQGEKVSQDLDNIVEMLTLLDNL